MSTSLNILDIPSKTQFWFIRAQGGKFYQDFLENNFIAISENELSLKEIKNFKTKYKIKNKHLTVEEFKVLISQIYQDISKQKQTLTANKLENFTANMQTGDFVIVPSVRSEKFAIGIIDSEIYEVTDSHINIEKINNKYSICTFYKRRKIKWIKEFSRRDLSDKLYWLLSAHQSLFNLSKYDNLILPLVANFYKKEDKIYSGFKINREENINNETWYTLHSIIRKISRERSKDIDIKLNVQSPGIVFLQSFWENHANIIAIVAVTTGIIFGEIDAFGVKFHGIHSYFFGDAKLDRDRKKLENELLAIKVESEKIDLQEKLKKANLTNEDSEAISKLEITPTADVNENVMNKQSNLGFPEK